MSVGGLPAVRKRLLSVIVENFERNGTMVRVKYTDNIECNDSVAEYPTVEETWEAIYREIDDVAFQYTPAFDRSIWT